MSLQRSLRRIWDGVLEEYERVFRYAEWNLGILMEPIHTLLRPDVSPRVSWLPRPREGTSLADPFAVTREGTTYIFCEEMDLRAWKGAISFIELKNGEVVSGPHVAIDAPFHISYPYLLEHDGEIFCVPETAQAREIGLYEAREFPYRWTKVATLIPDLPGIDPTIFQYEGRWWLTCGDDSDGPDYKLFVWHSPSLYGPWEPHEGNPVKVDISNSRPAGTPFVQDATLFRPAQDSSRSYGGRVVINRMLELTPTEFREEPVAVLEPQADSPYPDGIHTVSSAGDLTLVDGKRDAFIPGALKHSLKDAMRRRWKDALRNRWLRG